MTAKLTKELTDALHANHGQVKAVDPETGHIYFVVASEIHLQAMEALRRQQDHDAIARGISDMEGGRTKPLEQVHAGLREELRSKYGQ